MNFVGYMLRYGTLEIYVVLHTAQTLTSTYVCFTVQPIPTSAKRSAD